MASYPRNLLQSATPVTTELAWFLVFSSTSLSAWTCWWCVAGRPWFEMSSSVKKRGADSGASGYFFNQYMYFVRGQSYGRRLVSHSLLKYQNEFAKLHKSVTRGVFRAVPGRYWYMTMLLEQIGFRHELVCTLHSDMAVPSSSMPNIHLRVNVFFPRGGCGVITTHGACVFCNHFAKSHKSCLITARAHGILEPRCCSR